MEKPNNLDKNLLSLPKAIGRAIVESGAVIVCPLLGTDSFIRFCKERGFSIDRKRLFRLEKLGIFSPVFRVCTPRKDTPPFYIPIREGNNWFAKRWAWDCTAIHSDYLVPDPMDMSKEAYYSIFQIDYLSVVLTEMTLEIHMDGFLDENNIDWKKCGQQWIEYTETLLESLQEHEYRRSVGLLCQFISNRYYPFTQSDKRTIRVSGGHFSDRWLSINDLDWNWDDEVHKWNPKITEKLFDLTPEKLKHAYRSLSLSQSFCDPLENWYQLTQFISLDKRKKLKGKALRAETFRSGAQMLGFLYKDLYDEDLPDPHEITRTIIHHIPELEIRKDTRRYLEFVANDFGINPQPKLVLIVEGESEDIVVREIFDKYFGTSPGTYGIEIIILGGVGTATGTKKNDRFRAILRLVDYLHHHQTITFLILDNENYAKKLKHEAKKAKSKHNDKRYVTRGDYIRIWQSSFEFDNFSSSEITKALNQISKGYANFSRSEVIECKNNNNSGAELTKLYKKRTNYNLPKIKLNKILLEQMMLNSTGKKIENRPIIKVLRRISKLASQNPFPVTQEIWEFNQASKYFGKKQRQTQRNTKKKN